MKALVSSFDDLEAGVEGDDENEAELDNAEDLVNGEDIANSPVYAAGEVDDKNHERSTYTQHLKMISKRLIVEWTTAKNGVCRLASALRMNSTALGCNVTLNISLTPLSSIQATSIGRSTMFLAMRS